MRSLLTISLLFFGLTIHAQNVKFDYKTVQPSVFFAQVPYENVNGKIIVTAVVNGEQGRFIVDTGAPNMISTGFAEKLKTVSISDTKAKDVNGNTEKLNVVLINGLELGGVLFKDVSTVVSNTFILTCFNVDGIIGSNIFERSILQINKAENKVILTNDQTRITYDKSISNKLILSEGGQVIPYVSIDLGKVDNQVMFDLGYNGFYLISNQDFYKLKKSPVFSEIEEGSGNNAIGQSDQLNTEKHFRVSVSNFKLGKSLFKEVSAETSGGTNSIIGTKLLDFGNVTIDYINKYFCFEQTADPSSLQNKKWPITPTVGGGKFIVGVVWDKSIATQVRTNDQIIKINDIDYEHANMCDIVTSPNAILKNEVEASLTIRDQGGEVKTFKMTIKDPKKLSK